MKKYFDIRLSLMLGLFLIGCAHRPAQPQSPRVLEWVIVTTTDFHAALDQAEGLAQVIESLRAQYQDKMILIDGGDLFQGSLEGNLSKGKSIVEFYNYLKVDAAAIGNHELDYGPIHPQQDGMGYLKKRYHQAKFHWLSANMVDRQTQKPIFNSYAVLKRQNQNICIVGATTATTPYITSPLFIKNVDFTELKPALTAVLKTLATQEHCNRTILTAHAGLECDSKNCLQAGSKAEALRLLEQLPPASFSAMVAGHTHLLAQEVINKTPVIEAGARAQKVGVLWLYSNGEHEFKPFIAVNSQAHHPAVHKLLAPYRAQAQKYRYQPVTRLDHGLNRDYHHENELGNLLADALKLSAQKINPKVSLALLNAGGLRLNLKAGEINYGDVYEVLPFDNSLTIIELSGAEVKELIELAYNGQHGMPPGSGFRYFSQTKQILLNKNQVPLDPKQTYYLATIDFLVNGGDHQGAFYQKIEAARKKFYPSLKLRDILVDFLKKHPTIKASTYYNPAQPRIVKGD